MRGEHCCGDAPTGTASAVIRRRLAMRGLLRSHVRRSFPHVAVPAQVRKGAAHVGSGCVGRYPEQARVGDRRRWRPLLGGNAVEEHRLAFVAQLLDERGGISEQEVEVRVRRRSLVSISRYST